MSNKIYISRKEIDKCFYMQEQTTVAIGHYCTELLFLSSLTIKAWFLQVSSSYIKFLTSITFTSMSSYSDIHTYIDLPSCYPTQKVAKKYKGGVPQFPPSVPFKLPSIKYREYNGKILTLQP